MGPNKVAFYPSESDPGYLLSTCITADVVAIHDDGTMDLEVEGVVLERVPRLPEGEHATPHTWAP